MLIKLIHGNIDLYSEINEEARKAVVKQLLKIKSELQQHKSTIIKEELSLIKEIHSVAQKSLELVKFQEKKLDELIFKVQSLERINNDKETTFIKSILSISSTNLSKILSMKCPRLDVNTISKDIQNLFKLDELSEENFLLDMNYDNDQNIFKYIDKKVLWTFDATTKNFDKKELPIDIYLLHKSGGSACFLPDGSIFYYNHTSSAIINPSNAVKYLPKWQLRAKFSRSIYNNGYIYLFGDANDISAKFSITTNKWTPITKFSTDFTISAAPFSFKDYILLRPNKPYLVCYDTIIDSFSEISYTRENWNLALFFVANETLYFIDFLNQMYGMTDNLIVWNKIKVQNLPLLPESSLVYYPIIYNQKYYYLGSYAIWEFDLKNKNNKETCRRPS